MIHKIGLDRLIGSQKTRYRDLVLAMIVERLIRPCSKLATTRLWHGTTLADVLSGRGCAGRRTVCGEADWLPGRQSRLEKKLAARYFGEGGQVLLKATEEALEKLVKQVRRRTKTLLSAAEIGRKAGRIIHRFKVAKHFETTIADRQFAVINDQPMRSNAKPNWMESM